MKILASISFVCGVVYGQALSPVADFTTTVSGLPSASANTNKKVTITDGASACDVSTGGGSTRVFAVSNGSAWTAPNCGGSGSGGGFTCAATNVSANVLLCPAISGFTVPQTLMVTTGALTNPTSITSPTITVNSVAYTIVSNTGQGPRAGQIAPNSATLFLGISGTSAMILNDSIVFDSTMTCAWNSFPWTCGANFPAMYSLVNGWAGLNYYTPSVTQTLTAPTTVSCSNAIEITAASIITLTATPTIGAPAHSGQPCAITNTGTNAVTFQDKANLAGSALYNGGNNLVVNPGQTVLVWGDTTTGFWSTVAPGGGTTLTDACASGVGHFDFFGEPSTIAGASGAMTANTLYGWEVDAKSALCTIDHLSLATNGSGNYTLTIWNAAGTTQLVSSTPIAMGSNAFQLPVLASAFQLQPNTTYLITLTTSHTSDEYFLSTASAGFFTGMTVPRAFTCANSAAWSGSTPNLPSACGTRTLSTLASPSLMGYHN